MKLTSNNMSSNETHSMRLSLFLYWRLGTKLKDIMQDNRTWTEQLISDNMKVVMESHFAGETTYVN